VSTLPTRPEPKTPAVPEPQPSEATPEAKPPVPTPDPIPEITDKAPEVKKKEPEPKTVKSESASLEERLATLKAGRMDKALAQGRHHFESLKGTRWTLRLEVACQADTVQRATGMLRGQPDLWVMPIRMRDGKQCYQLMLGDYPSEGAAEQASRKLPAAFRAPGNRPKPFRLNQVPDKQ